MPGFICLESAAAQGQAFPASWEKSWPHSAQQQEMGADVCACEHLRSRYRFIICFPIRINLFGRHMIGKPPTPKQIAYLTYMGVGNAVSMDRQQAFDCIDKLFEVEDQNLWSWLYERQMNWLTDRFLLYPSIYRSELNNFLKNEFAQTLHDYVWSRVTGASEQLTKAKIRQVINDLTRENTEWWSTKDKKEIFFLRLAATFPACCDGKAPSKAPRQASPPRLIPAARFEDGQNTRRTSLMLPLVLLSAALIIGVISVLFMALRPSQSNFEIQSESPTSEQETNSKTGSSVTVAASETKSEASTGRQVTMRIISSGPYGAAGLIGIETAPVQTPAVVADLIGRQKDETWHGTLYRCGTHTFADSGRTVPRFAISLETAEVLNRKAQ
ncbi:MAG: hypothetical protein B7Z37_18965 [Verrucomicrobia bacterium 12-59-8]|nr:MAG: hypothetical protein B7Z37_18965 [Verrucomicrobia bacterium 12-59-8]